MTLKRIFLFSGLLLLLGGCKLTLLNPAGDVAAQQGDLIIYSTLLMLIVILPVMGLTVFFAFAYRASRKDATYEPDWDHSVSLEIVVWAVPLAIIICLGGLTWVATHRLDPYEDLPRISAETAIDPNVAPMQIQVIALDWKWMFIYPEEGIATVNEVAVITDRPIEWKLTSGTVMNAFYVPEMSGMIYAMAGMETELNAVVNAPGTYDGFSANYSGNGFSHMRFKLHTLDEADFDAWVEKVRTEGVPLDSPTYNELEEPSVSHPVEYYSEVEDGLWDRILNMCVGDDKLCQNDMMMVDALGGGGIEGLLNREIYRGICTADDPQTIFAMLRPELGERREEILGAMMATGPELLSSSSKSQAN